MLDRLALSVILDHRLDLIHDTGYEREMPDSQRCACSIPRPASFGAQETTALANVGERGDSGDDEREQDPLDVVDLKDPFPPDLSWL